MDLVGSILKNTIFIFLFKKKNMKTRWIINCFQNGFLKMVTKINYFMRIYFNHFHLFIKVVLEDDCANMNNTLK